MKILVTGAHFTPAKATVAKLSKKPDIKIVYVGRKTAMEGDSAPSAESLELPKLKIKYRTLITGRLRRSFDPLTILSLFKIPIGIVQSIYILLIERPDVILSFGGYVSVPIVFIGWLLSIPIITHEQGLTISLANKINNIFATKIALSYPRDDLGNKEIVTGNPLREEVLNPIKQMGVEYKQIFAESNKNELPVILITGGSQGSHAINIVLEGCLKELLKKACVIHQTGESKYRDFERLKNVKNERYLPVKWIGEEIGAILASVDLVICRSGINTLSEIAFLGIPALTIPIPKHFEQNQNAKYFQKINLARVLYQTKLSPKSLLEEVKQMLNNLPKLKQIAKNAKTEIIPDAAERLALETILLAETAIS